MELLNYDTPIYRDLIALSSGTISTLTGFSAYEQIDQVQNLLILFYIGHRLSNSFENWHDVWGAFLAHHNLSYGKH